MLSIYFDKGAMNDITYEENLIDSPLVPDSLGRAAQGSYLINLKDGSFGPTATNIRIVNNYLGDNYQFGILAGANVPWNVSGNTMSGNQNFLTGQPVANI